jgi:hypothetical protein
MTIRTSKCNTIIRSRPQLFFFGFIIKRLVCRQPLPWDYFRFARDPGKIAKLNSRPMSTVSN